MTEGGRDTRPRLPTGILKALIGLNAVVYLLWLLGPDPSRPKLFRFMVENFLVSRDHLAAGRYWTLLAAEFSHRELWHLALNMMVLYSFGVVLVHRWGSRGFLFFYLAAAVTASLGHVAVGWLIGRDAPALGASGAVSAALAGFSVLYPRHRILVFGVVPMPAYVAVLLFVGFDVWGVVAQGGGGGLPIGHGAHLGGAAFGLAYAVLQSRRRAGPMSRAEMAELLEKVRGGGIDALSPVEQARLEALLRSVDRSS